MKNFKHILTSVKKNILFCLLLLFAVTANAQVTDLSAMIQQARDAGIEEAQLEKIQSSAAEHGLSDQQLSDFIEPALALAEQGLPAEGILSKAQEGMSKSVPANRILSVLQNLRNATEQSASVADSWIGRDEIQSMIANAGAMSEADFRNQMIRSVSRSFVSNVPQEAISGLLEDIASEDVLSRTNPQSIVSAVAILPDLSTTPENPEISRSFLVRSLKGGFSPSELQKLPGAISIAQQRSQLPAANVIEGVANQMGNDIPAKQILQNLINGNIGGGPPGGLPKGLDNRNDQGGGG